MIIEEKDGIKILKPSEGYKYVTNGSSWSECVYLGKSASEDAWSDTNSEPPEPEDDEDASAADYENALGRFGV